jgi:serpin B
MKTAFGGSANFDRMIPRDAADDIRIDEVFHKTYIDLDEKGTEAAAATAVEMVFKGGGPSGGFASPIVRVDRPFLFSIQHVRSGACLFLGRVTDLRAKETITPPAAPSASPKR